MWVTKYRYKVVQGPMCERLREIITQTCNEMGVHIVKGVLARDHVHMFLSIPPKLALSNVMQQQIKGRSSRCIQMEFPELRRRYWGRRFNAIKCASCGQAEYLTRSYCRCGHYLRGQLEDEFLAWETEIRADHERLAEHTQRKLKPLRLLYLASLPCIVFPMIYLALSLETSLIYPSIAMLVGFVFLGSVALAESVLMKPVKASSDFLRTYTFESFVEDRFFRQMMTCRQ